jgi:hypothetical protein
MTSSEVEKLIRAKLQDSSLLDVIDEFKSQFLEFPDGFFVELVLTDGAKLVDVERIGREVRESLRKQNVDLDVIVRAIWTVKEVGDPCTPPDSSGKPQLGRWRVLVTLASGGLTRRVEVDVLYAVVQDIKNRIAGNGWSDASAIKEVVREFIEMELALGGESYWDPIRDSKQEISGSALSYLFMHTPVAQTLGIQR